MTKVITVHVKEKFVSRGESCASREPQRRPVSKFLDDPAAVVGGPARTAARQHRSVYVRPEALPETEPKFSYPVEWDNFAVLAQYRHFDELVDKAPDSGSRPGTRRIQQAEKNGVTVLREAAIRRRVWLPGSVKSTMNVPSGREDGSRHYGNEFRNSAP